MEGVLRDFWVFQRANCVVASRVMFLFTVNSQAFLAYTLFRLICVEVRIRQVRGYFGMWFPRLSSAGDEAPPFHRISIFCSEYYLCSSLIPLPDQFQPISISTILISQVGSILICEKTVRSPWIHQSRPQKLSGYQCSGLVVIWWVSLLMHQKTMHRLSSTRSSSTMAFQSWETSCQFLFSSFWSWYRCIWEAPFNYRKRSWLWAVSISIGNTRFSAACCCWLPADVRLSRLHWTPYPTTFIILIEERTSSGSKCFRNYVGVRVTP